MPINKAQTIKKVRTDEPDRIVRLPELMTIVGLRKTQIYEDISLGKFPNSIPLSGRARGWRLSEIRDWIEARAAERDCAAA